VPLLGAGDPLPGRPQRILVAGTSGSGKTTLAGRVADALAAPHIEIDALYHGPAWTPLASFESEVRRFSAEPRWVTEWQYDVVRRVLAERADLVVWLDLPKAVVMRRVVLRTVRRRMRREELWNGNLEPPLRTFVTDPEHIVRWAWTTHHKTGPRLAALRSQRPDLVIVRLRNRSAVNRWLRGPLRRAAEGNR
jgi:adenylate kinase family enzyme